MQWLHDYAKERGLLHVHPKAKKKERPILKMNFNYTIDSVFDYIMQETQTASFALEYQLVWGPSHHPDQVHMMCIYSNYRRKGKAQIPTLEVVKKLQGFLEFAELPGWYIDYEHWGWGFRHPKRFTVTY